MARATTFKFTFWKLVFLFMMAAGLYATFVRFTQGLGASTHLSDQFPWGIWVSFDVLCGVMLAAGGFTLTAAVHILNIKRLHSIIRPTILTAFLGYILVSAALMFDLGKPYNIWHPLIMRNPHSVMFEVAYCVMLYTTVLALEFSPIVLERFNMQKPLKIIRAILIPLVIFGVILSTLHQSSLGTLYLIVPEKLYPLWYSPLLPLFFFLSAIAVGLAMTIFESSMSSKHFGLQLELPVLQELGRVLVVVLGVYAILRFEDLRQSRRAETDAAAGIRDVSLLAGDFALHHPAAAAVGAAQGALQRERTLPCRRPCSSRLHHQPHEREHHGLRRFHGCSVLPQMDRVGRHRNDYFRRIRSVRYGSEVLTDFPPGRRTCSGAGSATRCRRNGSFAGHGACGRLIQLVGDGCL